LKDFAQVKEDGMGTERQAPAEQVFTPERLMESCEDDVMLAKEVLQEFRRTAPTRLSQLAAAVTALDSAQIRFEAHSIKGSSRTIGADALAAVIARLEMAGVSGDLSDAPVLLAEAEKRLSNLECVLTAYLADH
jgi:HPt (histidine-containing phosphotransfer) domain-containing protein